VQFFKGSSTCRPFYASLGIMTSRMVLHLLKNLANDGDLAVVVVDLNWTVLDTEERNRTWSRTNIMVETDSE
jgi:hypothetical protein